MATALRRIKDALAMERNVLVMGISAIFLNLAMSLYRPPFNSLYFESLGADLVLIGGIFSVLAATRGLIQVPGGDYADMYGRKTLIVLGGAVYAASLLPIYWITGNFWFFSVICLMFAQLGIMLYQPGAQAMISESISAKRRATGFATFYFIISLGSLVSPVLAGYLSVGGNYGILFLLASLILMGVVISRVILLKETRVEREPDEERLRGAQKGLGFVEKMRLAWDSSSSTRAYLVFTLLSSIAFSIAGPYFAFFLSEGDRYGSAADGMDFLRFHDIYADLADSWWKAIR